MTDLKAPFPWYGSKGKFSDAIWSRLGDPDVYVEPFAGSLAALLKRPSGGGLREIVCDTDGGIVNFWRAVSADPEAVAQHADYPTFHQDLSARHRWLRDWIIEHSPRLSEDPEYYDAKAAGWWVWGICRWIGGGWCSRTDEGRPLVQSDKSSRGVNIVPNKIPHMNHKPGARIAAPKDQVPAVDCWPTRRGTWNQTPELSKKRPFVQSGRKELGINTDSRPFVPDHPAQNGTAYSSTDHIVRWMLALQERLRNVIVLNRDWTSAVTPTLLMHTKSSPKNITVGVLLDPPYLTADRHGDLYQSDRQGDSNSVAVESYRWSIENGDRFRIAYCCHAGDFDVPAGWESVETTFSGIKRDDRKARMDQIMFSPACVQTDLPLFAASASSGSAAGDAPA
ncbi:MAG: DNA adenine methylase [Rhodospirillales bacterium]|nr:DNA adenine methylase [Rhodospirillales bacterium]